MCSFQGHRLKISSSVCLSFWEAVVRRRSNGGDGGDDGDAHGGDGAHASEPWAQAHQEICLLQAAAPSQAPDEAQRLMWHCEAWCKHAYCDCSASSAAVEQDDSTSWLGDAREACLICCGSAETWGRGGDGHRTAPGCHDLTEAIDDGQNGCHVQDCPDTAAHRVTGVCGLKSNQSPRSKQFDNSPPKCSGITIQIHT